MGDRSAGVTAVLGAAPAVVFAHLTDPALMTRWWPEGAATDPVVGGRYHLWWDGPGWHLRGEYLLVEAPQRVVWTWSWDHEHLPPRRVDVRLGPADGGRTRLAIEHEAGDAAEAQSYVEGWEHFLARLETVLESAR